LGDERSDERLPPAADVAALDRLVARLVETTLLRFAVATTDGERDAAYRLRHDAVVAGGWAEPTPDGREHDLFDSAAVHVLGWNGPTAVCAGRLVPPPGPLPTEQACGITVQPTGQVVDVGRMVVAPSHRGRDHRVFVLLLGHLYLEVRRLGFSVGCGMMTAPVRALARQLGFAVEVLGPERVYWHEARAPVRFAANEQAASLLYRWAEP
jgi:hypothetical protein